MAPGLRMENQATAAASESYSGERGWIEWLEALFTFFEDGARFFVVEIIELREEIAMATYSSTYAAAHGLSASTAAEMAADAAIGTEVLAGIERANAALSRVEQIKRHTILPEEWQPGGDELTPTMKLRRRPISEKYAAEIDAMYA